MTSTLPIDCLIENHFRYNLTNPKYWMLKVNLMGCDFQDTEMNNETECYFYFHNSIANTEDFNQCKEQIRDILGLPNDYKFLEEDQTKDGNPEIRLEAICHIEI